ncbi:hypothetical protein HWC26_gp190 [Aeromonas phage 2L372X]|uniref:Uncharacterized protein n=2 Tax=Plateaulakevirus TaxID=2843436 RepID=A0A5B9N7D9_9CAUD|nr:hypothetical protein HWC25_gp189 [Aeromonas phage 2L372D]YP_009846527.1 hypothetical protein HWC26_gp190 [Aeromonas phage 2L372X]QDB74103.1 hypothetical protein 2L372D_189 [Aeromonas phage 2L372D]QEG08442.1 hypothetical protein [Aeromonas phage 2L372X]
MVENKNKREKPEDLIGWKSLDGRLEVVGIHGKQGTNALFKVTCTECSKDKELFPDGYFIITKRDLVKGKKPCGCSKKPEWEDWQYLILARRAGEKKGFIVHGFAEEFKNSYTKLNLECLKDGYKWTASINNVINKRRGCSKCKGITLAEQHKTPEHIALQKCGDICKEMNYDVIGFPDCYKNNRSRFEYVCKIHGKQNVSYHNFVNQGTRCGGCAKDLGNGNGYYPERKDEIDFLYVLNFDNKFIKVGRSFDVDERIKGLRTLSKVPKKKIHKLRIFTATHQEIYDYEQELHNELRERNFQHYVDWSTECFENDCQFILNKLLDNCGLEEVK